MQREVSRHFTHNANQNARQRERLFAPGRSRLARVCSVFVSVQACTCATYGARAPWVLVHGRRNAQQTALACRNQNKNTSRAPRRPALDENDDDADDTAAQPKHNVGYSHSRRARGPQSYMYEIYTLPLCSTTSHEDATDRCHKERERESLPNETEPTHRNSNVHKRKLLWLWGVGYIVLYENQLRVDRCKLLAITSARFNLMRNSRR